MISSFSELKNKALGDLKGNWTQPVLATLVYVLIAAIFSDTPYVKHTYTNGIQTTQTNFTVWSGICLLVSLFFILPMAYSYMLIFLDFIRGEKEKLVGKLFSFFKNYGRAFGTSFMVILYTILWSLLLVIPGIIKAFSYAMTPYILHEYPTVGVNDAIDISRNRRRYDEANANPLRRQLHDRKADK